jgi:hypothetical protein
LIFVPPQISVRGQKRRSDRASAISRLPSKADSDPTQPLYFHGLALERERGIAGNHKCAIDARQVRGQALGYTINEVTSYVAPEYTRLTFADDLSQSSVVRVKPFTPQLKRPIYGLPRATRLRQRVTKGLPMTITLNHTIVPAQDKRAVSQFFAHIFGLHAHPKSGHFAAVRINDALTLLFDDHEEFEPHHYAFHVSDAEFDAILGRIREAKLAYGSAPWSLDDGKLNDWTAAAASIFATPTAMCSNS